MAKRTIVTIGTFDGVHLGHQAILAEVKRRATLHALPSVAYTFRTPPRTDRAGTSAPILLLADSLKLALLRRSVDHVEQVSLADVHELSPEAFVDRVLVERFDAHTVVVGETFRFGRKRAGDVQTLCAVAGAAGFNVAVVPSVSVRGSSVSSSRIRRLLRAGDVASAADLLGRSPILTGEVVTGDKIGEKLGRPTANLRIDRRVLLPPHGVYLVHAFVHRTHNAGLLYLGTRPTLRGGEFRCEVHLLEPPEHALYGETIEVHLLERLREDRTFDSLDALRRQIAYDEKRAVASLKRFPWSDGPIGG